MVFHLPYNKCNRSRVFSWNWATHPRSNTHLLNGIFHMHLIAPSNFKSHNNIISSQFQGTSSRFSNTVSEKPPKSRARISRIRFFPLSWHTTTDCSPFQDPVFSGSIGSIRSNRSSFVTHYLGNPGLTDISHLHG